MKHRVKILAACLDLGVSAECNCGWSERTTEMTLGDEVWRRVCVHLNERHHALTLTKDSDE